MIKVITSPNSKPGPVLLSLTSRQVWPHILAVAHLEPSRLILLHSDDSDESKRPAENLQNFFHQAKLVPERPKLEKVPYNDFNEFRKRLDKLEERLDFDSGCILNFTGGNKLMATAAFQWAAERHMSSFYLERGNQLTWFEPSENGFVTRLESLDGHLTDTLDPLALLRCQLSTSEVERAGERLILNNVGKNLPEENFRKKVQGGASKRMMNIEGEAGRGTKPGDQLEFDCAAVLLKLRVREIRRSLRLKVNAGGSGNLPHAEIDLLFNWNGKLWLIDCKDRVSEDSLIRSLCKKLPENIRIREKGLLDRIHNELKVKQTKVLKEDLIAINDIGGLLGQVVCVRKSILPEETAAYAKRNRIEVIQKNHVFDGFRRLLYPDSKPSNERLTELEKHFSNVKA